MNRIVIAILSVGVTVAAKAQTAAPISAGPSGSSSALIGIVNAQRLALESAPGKEAYARLQKLQSQKKDELDKLEKEARELVQKLNDQGPSMPADKRETLDKQADDKQKAWKRAQEDAQRDLQEAERKEMAALEARIGPVVKEYFKEKRYAVVLDARAGIIYADEATDLTDEVLKRINTTVALPPARPAASPASGATVPGGKPPAPKPTAAPKKP